MNGQKHVPDLIDYFPTPGSSHERPWWSMRIDKSLVEILS